METMVNLHTQEQAQALSYRSSYINIQATQFNGETCFQAITNYSEQLEFIKLQEAGGQLVDAFTFNLNSWEWEYKFTF